MAPVRQVVIGGIAGEIITAACAHIVKDVRRASIKDVNSYQHKQKEADIVPFLDVYSENAEVAMKAAGYIYDNRPIYPEMCLEWWSLERVIITEEVKTASRHFAKGLVISRGAGGYDQTIRLWVEVEKFFASNGNNYKTDRHCHSANKDEQADIVLRTACEDEQIHAVPEL